MIFIPEKEKCIIWNDMPEAVYILYEYNKSIQFQYIWHKDEKKELKPYKLELTQFIFMKDSLGNLQTLPVLNCIDCQCSPELRYNNIIKKWFCICSSSLICTKNDDKDELNHPWIKSALENDSLNEENGFFDHAIEAIIYWNQLIIKNYNNDYNYIKNLLIKE